MSSKFGCCVDGVTEAKGENFEGCETAPENLQGIHFINSAKEIFNYSENFQLVVLFQRKEGHVEIIQLNGSLIWTMVDVLDFGMVGVMVMEIVIEQKKSVIKSV